MLPKRKNTKKCRIYAGLRGNTFGNTQVTPSILMLLLGVICMAKIKPEQVPDTMKLLQEDLPALLLAVGKIEDTDAYWEEVWNGCMAVYQKHTNGFAKRMLQAFAGYLEEQAKKMKQANYVMKREGDGNESITKKTS